MSSTSRLLRRFWKSFGHFGTLDHLLGVPPEVAAAASTRHDVDGTVLCGVEGRLQIGSELGEDRHERASRPAATGPVPGPPGPHVARVGKEVPLQYPGRGDIRLIAFITDPVPIRKILTYLGEPLEPPPVSPARGPPTNWGELLQIHDDRAKRRSRQQVRDIVNSEGRPTRTDKPWTKQVVKRILGRG